MIWQSMPNDRPMPLRVLARLPFTFLVIAFFLGWEGYKRHLLLGGADWRTALYFFAAMVSLVLAFTGLRERYRNQNGG